MTFVRRYLRREVFQVIHLRRRFTLFAHAPNAANSLNMGLNRAFYQTGVNEGRHTIRVRWHRRHRVQGIIAFHRRLHTGRSPHTTTVRFHRLLFRHPFTTNNVTISAEGKSAERRQHRHLFGLFNTRPRKCRIHKATEETLTQRQALAITVITTRVLLHLVRHMMIVTA